MTANKTQTFRATLEQLRGNLGWTIARIPFDPHAKWEEMNRLRVIGTINGFVFRTSLFPFSEEKGFFLLVNKTMQKGAKVALGGVAQFTLEPDLEARTPRVPDELAVFLRQDKHLKKFYEELSPSARNDIYKTISEPKSPDARQRRAEQMAERFLLTMEAEHILPPILTAAFTQKPMARKGWEIMTSVQRRGHLMGIFYYQTPEARQKRANKAVDEAIGVAKKKQT